MYRLIGRKSRTFLFCCTYEIGIIDSFPSKEIARKLDSDSDSGQEDDVNGLVEMIEEMKVDEQIQMKVEIKIDFGMKMEMEEERQRFCSIDSYLLSKILIPKFKINFQKQLNSISG